MVLVAVVIIAFASLVLAKPKAVLGVIQRLRAAALSDTLLPIGLVVVALVSVLSLWLLPRLQTSKLQIKPEARFDKENESRKTLAQIIGACS